MDSSREYAKPPASVIQSPQYKPKLMMSSKEISKPVMKVQKQKEDDDYDDDFED